MTSKLTIDGAGRVTLPKSLRKELHLETGDTLRFEVHGEQIPSRPQRAAAPIRQEDGIWVYRSGQTVPLSMSELIEEGRDERHLKNLGFDTHPIA